MRKKWTWPREWRGDWRQRARSGPAAGEVAIVLPIFLMLLFGIIQFGSVLLLHKQMVKAPRETGRPTGVGEGADRRQRHNTNREEAGEGERGGESVEGSGGR